MGFLWFLQSSKFVTLEFSAEKLLQPVVQICTRSQLVLYWVDKGWQVRLTCFTIVLVEQKLDFGRS